MFSIFKKNKKVPKISNIDNLIKQYGYEIVIKFLCLSIITSFSRDTNIQLHEIEQFLREEADAASQGDEMAKSFANILFDDPSYYRGAMQEEAKYPIDGPNGPQQRLLRIILPLKNRPDLMISVRCSIVMEVFRNYKAIKDFVINSNSNAIVSIMEERDKLFPIFEEIQKKYIRDSFSL